MSEKRGVRALRPQRPGMAYLDDAIARWLADPPRSYHVADEFERGMATYGYDVAMAEIRSILRDPSGERTTSDPSPAELRVAARSSSKVETGVEK